MGRALLARDLRRAGAAAARRLLLSAAAACGRVLRWRISAALLRAYCILLQRAVTFSRGASAVPHPAGLFSTSSPQFLVPDLLQLIITFGVGWFVYIS